MHFTFMLHIKVVSGHHLINSIILRYRNPFIDDSLQSKLCFNRNINILQDVKVVLDGARKM